MYSNLLGEASLIIVVTTLSMLTYTPKILIFDYLIYNNISISSSCRWASVQLETNHPPPLFTFLYGSTWNFVNINEVCFLGCKVIYSFENWEREHVMEFANVCNKFITFHVVPAIYGKTTKVQWHCIILDENIDKLLKNLIEIYLQIQGWKCVLTS